MLLEPAGERFEIELAGGKCSKKLRRRFFFRGELIAVVCEKHRGGGKRGAFIAVVERARNENAARDAHLRRGKGYCRILGRRAGMQQVEVKRTTPQKLL